MTEANRLTSRLEAAAESADPDEKSEGFLERFAKRVEERLAEPVIQRDTGFIARLLPLMQLFNRYFDSEVRGWERLPEQRPLLLVGNHSGGLLVPDTSAFIAGWYERQGLDDTLLGLAFDSMFGVPGVETLMRKLGEIPASPENAERALSEGASLLVYPGGAREAFRPWSERNRIEFGGHKGFVRLALKTGVPVVPVVAHGGHESTIVLSRGERLAEWLGTAKLRMHVAPILWQVPWGLSTPLQVGLPLPAKITVEIGAPLDWSGHGPEAADAPEIVQRCYDEITAAMQAQLTALARERPFPVLSRLGSLLPDFVLTGLFGAGPKPGGTTQDETA